MDTPRTTLLEKRAEILGELATLEELPGDRGEISFGKRVGEGTAMAVDRLSQVAVHDKLQLDDGRRGPGAGEGRRGHLRHL